MSDRERNAEIVRQAYEASTAWQEPWPEISYETREIETPDDDHVLVHVHQLRLHIYPDRESALAATAP